MDDESQPLEILLVAASPELRASYRDLLNMYTSGDRYAFIEAATAQAGVEHFDPKTNACVIASDDLPDLPLEAFLEQLRQRSAVVPVVVIGTSSGADARERAIAAGAMTYLPQSALGAKTLSHAVLDTLARAESERAQQVPEPEPVEALEPEEVAPEPSTPSTAEPSMANTGRLSSGSGARFARPVLAIPVECVFDHRRLNGSVDLLSRTGARVQGLTARPAVGALVTLRLRLLEGAPPLEIPSHVTEHVPGNGTGFSVVFDSLDRRKRELLRVVTSRGRKGPPV